MRYVWHFLSTQLYFFQNCTSSCILSNRSRYSVPQIVWWEIQLPRDPSFITFPLYSISFMFHVLLSQLSRASQPPTEAMSRRSGVDPKKNESNYISHTVSLIRSKVKTTFFVQNSNILTRFIKIFCFLSASEIFRRSDTWFRSRQCFEQNSRIALTNFCHDLTWLKITTFQPDWQISVKWVRPKILEK